MTTKEKDIYEIEMGYSFSDPNAQELKGIIINDGVCGMGKTHNIIEEIVTLLKKSPHSRILFISPFLDEIDRINKTLTDKGVKKISATKNVGRGKLEDLKNLLRSNANILATHALFTSFDQETIDLINCKNYHLIIDEEPPVISTTKGRYSLGLSSEEVTTFINNGTLKINSETNAVTWDTQGGNDYRRYNDVKQDCDRNNIIMYSDKGNYLLLWRLNPEIIKSFKTVRVLTYLFKGSFFQAYLDLYKIPYLIKDLTSIEVFSNKHIYPYHQLIDVFTPKKYTISNPNDLSVAWLKHRASAKDLKDLKNSTVSYFKTTPLFQTIPPKKDEKLWSTYKAYKGKLGGAGYTTCFLPYNSRATNSHIKVNKMAYLVNIFIFPPVFNYLTSKGVSVSKDTYALSMMLQWLFRGAIRTGKPIQVFIPSPRMRKLLENWMKEFGDFYDFSWEIALSKDESSISQHLSTDDLIDITTYYKETQPGLQKYPFK